jgi:hypothetical protein
MCLVSRTWFSLPEVWAPTGAELLKWVLGFIHTSGVVSDMKNFHMQFSKTCSCHSVN